MSIILCYVYRWFREVCSTTLLNTTILLGDPGKIVQVDESLFRRKPTVKLRIFITIYYHILVPCWSPTCIGNLGLRQGRHLSVTSTGVHADCARQNSCHSPPYSATACCPRICRPFRQWASYNQVGNLQTVSAHGTVIHSIEFVSPSGVYMQNTESYWNHTKMKLKRMWGCAAIEVPSYTWMSSCGGKDLERHLGRCVIAQQYPV